MNYWVERANKAQEILYEKGVAETNKQLRKYYKQSMKNAIARYLITYNKIQLKAGAGKQPTPADLYKLNTYWQLQGQMRDELQKLGDRTAKKLSKNFMEMWEETYKVWAARDDIHFSEMDYNAAKQVINAIWCADGKSWSERVWENTAKLQEALNEGLAECVIAGANPRNLRERLMYEFETSFSQTDNLVRTEMAHIQTESTKQRYKDMGVKYIKVWASKDERRCEICGKLHEQTFPIEETSPVPAHPRCRCAILPVID